MAAFAIFEAEDCLDANPTLVDGGVVIKTFMSSLVDGDHCFVDGDTVVGLNRFLISWICSGHEKDHVIKASFFLTDIVDRVIEDNRIHYPRDEDSERCCVEEAMKPLFEQMKRDLRGMLERLEEVEYD